MSSRTLILWRPSNPENTPMSRYRQHVNRKFGLALKDTQELVAWSVEQDHAFWLDIYAYLELQPPLPASMTKAYEDSKKMSEIPKWFEGLSMNYAENVLINADTVPEKVALVGVREGGSLDGVERVTWRELRSRVARVSNALRKKGVRQGDVVAALVSTSVEAVVLFLSTATIGAVFSSISPDLGAEGCISRLKQISPKIVFADADASYRGKRTSTIPKVKSIVSQLPDKPQVYIIPTPRSDSPMQDSSIAPLSTYCTFLSGVPKAQERPTYVRVPFTYPLVICYSSGTTGTPKCIVHQHGLLLNLKKISQLHNSLTSTDVVLQYSSTSWVLFYVMNGHLSTGATTICYDGSPLFPDARHFLRLLAHHRGTYLGTSPRYLYELEKAGVHPQQEFDLSSLRMVNTTGATLGNGQYYWFYNHFPPQVHLSNSAGGTDTATSLISVDPAGPLHVGEMQIRALGISVDIFDPSPSNKTNNTSASILTSGEPGEMVVTKPFPSMPCFFWGDSTSKSIYRAAYFDRFKEHDLDVWAQHDWLSFNPATKGWKMHGRSDGVLNPSGIRFGSGEIYAIAESKEFLELGVADTLCVGRRRKGDVDEEVFLFVIMREGGVVEGVVEERLRRRIREGLSSRHVPRHVVQVKEIPMTVNGKKVETAVKAVISGREVRVSSTVANPECLKGFKRFVDFEGRRESKL